MKNDIQKNEYLMELEEKLNEKIERIEIAQFLGSDKVCSQLKIHRFQGKDDIWGTLVFAEKNIYFYIPYSPASYMSFFTSKDQKTEPDQIINLLTLKEVSFAAEKPSFVKKIFAPESLRTIHMSFTGTDDIEYKADFIMQKKVMELLDLLNRK